MEITKFISKCLNKHWVAEVIFNNMSLMDLLSLRVLKPGWKDVVDYYLKRIQELDMTTEKFVSKLFSLFSCSQDLAENRSRNF